MAIPTPNQYFKYIVDLKKISQGNYTQSHFLGRSGYYVYDTKDNSNDKLTVLGDITNDQFQASEKEFGGPTASVDYVGQTSDGKNILFNFNGSYYEFTNVYNNGSMLTASNTPHALCFASGSRIRTTHGDIAVEDLAVGDLVITCDGRRKPIRWLGHRTTRCDRHPDPRKVRPVRVAAGTFGDGLPYADLWLSPGHALCLDGCLVPVRGLIDGERVAQVEQDEVTYWHVEVDGHDVLLANGLPAESYLDTGNRRGFANAAEVMDLHFDEDPAPGYDMSGYCLPMIESGPRLSAIRARHGLGAPAAKVACAETNIHLVADGAVIAPHHADENELRFLAPAGAADLRLVSPSFAADGADVRRLGVIVAGLAVSDGAGWRAVALDDPGLFAGFHDVEHDGGRVWRWTDGEGHLSPALWAGLAGDVLLRVTGVFDRLSRGGKTAEAA